MGCRKREKKDMTAEEIGKEDGSEGETLQKRERELSWKLQAKRKMERDGEEGA